MKKLIITELPRWNYFQWFLLGFYELEKRGDIRVKFKTNLLTKLTTLISSHVFNEAYLRYLKRYADGYNLRGYVEYNDKTKKYFCIDSADAPFLFDGNDLAKANVYFKMQCPNNLQLDNFELAPGVYIPWQDHAHVNAELKLTECGKRKELKGFSEVQQKIAPLMVGPRKLDRTNLYERLIKSYTKRCDYSYNEKRKKLMAYFGNSDGPILTKNVQDPDYDWEADILSYFGDKIQHPNIKRGKACELIQSINAKDEGGTSLYDTRIIHNGNSDTGTTSRPDLIVPYEEFNEFVSKFQYNLNISGYRMSIPNRFIESFMVGTGIITDKLSVRWYLPFEDELIETVPMGYLVDNQVNWTKFQQDILDSPNISPNKVRDLFTKKWTPIKVAEYIIKTIDNA